MDTEELKDMKVAQLRELAAGLDGLTGYSQMKKGELIQAIVRHQKKADKATARARVKKAKSAAPAAPSKPIPLAAPKGSDKASIKTAIRELKLQRDQVLALKDRANLRRVRRRIHRLKRRIRNAAP